MAFRLHINQQEYLPQEILQPGSLEPQSAQQQAVFDFVRQWLSGQQVFQVQTSGSTGTPKLITVSRQRMQASAHLSLQALGISAGELAMLCIHADYIGGKMMLVRAMEGGLPLVVLEPEANPLKALPADFQPQYAALVPIQVQTILQDKTSLLKLSQMKAVIVGGAPVSPALEEALQQVQAPLYSTYGMTETVSHIALRRLNGSGRQDYFQALPNIQLSTDARDCLVIEGPVVEAPVVTNDRVSLLGQNRFRWLGRVDNVINSAGIKVQAERIEILAEAFLAALGEHRRVLAGGLADEKLGQRVVLLIEGIPLMMEAELQLQQYLVQHLPRYWAPKKIKYSKNFVESSNGKIKRTETWAGV